MAFAVLMQPDGIAGSSEKQRFSQPRGLYRSCRPSPTGIVRRARLVRFESTFRVVLNFQRKSVTDEQPVRTGCLAVDGANKRACWLTADRSPKTA
jgi:hypothetical protein